MFTDFYYLLRERGINVSMTEWLTLLDGLNKGLHKSSVDGFYYLCRSILVKSESDFDRFDQIFLEYFEGVLSVEGLPELPKEFLKWLNHPSEELEQPEHLLEDLNPETIKELLIKFQERLKEQKSEHNGGSYWIATQGISRFGNNGWHPGGMRVGGISRWNTGSMVIGDRRYRDFRKDNTLSTRQYQMAFRTLRRLALEYDSAEREFDLDETIQATCKQGGLLKVKKKPPRKNSIKLLLLLDSGGSMDPHAKHCSQLLQAAVQSHFFKELHTYYFHNCVYDNLYKEPTLSENSKIATDWILRKHDDDYRVIIVGDALMNDYELWGRRYNWATQTESQSGLEWIQCLLKNYPRLIWLNPCPHPRNTVGWWGKTYFALEQLVPMYPLSVDGLEQGMKNLLTKK